MLNDMPCGKEKVIDYENHVLAATELKNAIINGKLFGFVKCKLAFLRTEVENRERLRKKYRRAVNAHAARLVGSVSRLAQ